MGVGKIGGGRRWRLGSRVEEDHPSQAARLVVLDGGRPALECGGRAYNDGSVGKIGGGGRRWRRGSRVEEDDLCCEA